MAESSLYNKILKQEEDFLVSLVLSNIDSHNPYLSNTKGLPNAIIDSMNVNGIEDVSDNGFNFVIDNNQAYSGRLIPGSYLRANFHFDSENTFENFASANMLQIGSFTQEGGISFDNVNFKYGDASLFFDGVDDAITLSQSGTGFNFFDEDFTIGVWVRIPATGAFTIMSSGSGDGDVGFDWIISETGMTFSYTTDGVAANVIDLDSDELTWNTDTWYYITVERNGSDFNFYRDGINVGTSSISGSIFSPNGNGAIGKSSNFGSDYFSGNMDELTVRYKAIYNGNFVPPTGQLTSEEAENVDVESVTYDLSVDIGRLKVILLGDLIDSNFTFEISLDNGTTYTPVPLVFRNKTDLTIMAGSIPASITSTNQLKYKITSTNNNEFTLNIVIISWDTKISEQESITEPSASGGATAQDVWEYSDRTLTSASGISMDDVIATQADLPVGNLTVRQAFELLIKRLKRDKNSPKI